MKIRCEPNVVEMNRISVALNSRSKEFPDSDEGRMRYWKQMKQLFANCSKSKLQWMKDSESVVKKRVVELGLSHAGPWGGKKVELVGAGRTKGCRAQKKTDR